jgi:hypothetical protein
MLEIDVLRNVGSTPGACTYTPKGSSAILPYWLLQLATTGAEAPQQLHLCQGRRLTGLWRLQLQLPPIGQRATTNLTPRPRQGSDKNLLDP